MSSFDPTAEHAALRAGGAGLGLSAAAAIVEEIHKCGANAAARHAQMYARGARLRQGDEAQRRHRRRVRGGLRG